MLSLVILVLSIIIVTAIAVFAGWGIYGVLIIIASLILGTIANKLEKEYKEERHEKFKLPVKLGIAAWLGITTVAYFAYYIILDNDGILGFLGILIIISSIGINIVKIILMSFKKKDGLNLDTQYVGNRAKLQLDQEPVEKLEVVEDAEIIQGTREFITMKKK